MKKIIYIFLMIILGITIISCNQDSDESLDEITQVEEVINLINTLPSQITLDDEKLINQITTAYQQLTNDEKAQVTNVNKYLSSLDTLNNLLEEEKKKENALIVVELINNLPSVSNLTIVYEDSINYTKTLYEALTEEEKGYVTNIDKLFELEEQIKTLRIIELYKKEAQTVIDLIDALPSIDALTIDDKNILNNARLKYNLLSINAKPYVDNLDNLVLLEERLIELEKIYALKTKAQVVIDLINKIPSINNLTIDDEETISKANTAYNNLKLEEQSYVTNLEHLNLAMEKIKELLKNKKYDVYFNLNGGTLDGLTEVYDEGKTIEFKVNYYSESFFSYPDSQIFIYKTSLITSDTFKYAYKVGFSYDEKINKYVVKQIIKNETALDQTNKTSQYYILVHVSNSTAYNLIQEIEVGQYLEFNKTLPENALSNLNLNVVVKKEGEVIGYKKEFVGFNTLSVPTRSGYIFMGWYLDNNFINGPITEVSDKTKVYAKWITDTSNITTENILNVVSDVVTSNTLDNLISKNEDATFTWSSSNNKLYSVDGGIGKTNKIYQTHKNQKVEVFVEIRYNNGDTIKLSKEITIAPVLYNAFPNTPVATYFYTGAISAYQKYNTRYKTEGTLFSYTTKESLDIVYYSFIVPDAKGNVTIQNLDYLDEVKKLKEYDVRIIACVNGVSSTTSQAFKTITASESLRKTFINNLMDLVEEYNFDGVDIDWEAVNSTIKPVASQLNLLIKELRAEMNNRTDAGGSPYFLSIAVPASSYGTATDRFDFPTLNKYLDYINIMSYDLNNADKTTHLSPLYKSAKDNGYGFSCDYGISRLTSLGVSRDKLIIGCAGYGKAYKVTGSISSTYPGLGVSGTLTQISGVDGSFASGTVYGSAISYLINTGKYVQYTEKNASGQIVGSYLYNKLDKIFITYDSSEAVYAKYQYADSMEGVGIMCWAYTEDTSDIVINAIADAIKDKN